MEDLEELLALTITGALCHTGIVVYLCIVLRKGYRAKYRVMINIMYLFLASNIFAALYYLMYLAKHLDITPQWLLFIRISFSLTYTVASSANLSSHWLFAHNYYIFSITMP